MPGNICSLAKMESLAPGKKTGNLLLLPLFFSFFASAVNFSPPKYSACHSKHFGYDGTVCVCSDELECDSFSEGSPLSHDEYAVYTSSKAGDRFSLRTGKIQSDSKGSPPRAEEAELTFTVNQSEIFQTILGFGGAFTGTENNLLSCIMCKFGYLRTCTCMVGKDVSAKESIVEPANSIQFSSYRPN